MSWKTESVVCRRCDHHFEATICRKPRDTGGKTTDFHAPSAGVRYLVVRCPNCNIVGHASDFTADGHSYSFTCRCDTCLGNNNDIFDDVFGIEQSDLDALVEKVKDENGAASANWWQLGRELAIMGADHRTIADCYLRAAWSAVEENDIEAERYYRLQAVDEFIYAFDQFDTIKAEEKPSIAYLIGELFRRIGMVKASNKWFLIAIQMTEESDNPSSKWVVDAANQQMTTPREWFG